MILLHEIEKRYEFAPESLSRAMSSPQRRYESVATSPLEPSLILPGVWEKVSQIEGERP